MVPERILSKTPCLFGAGCFEAVTAEFGDSPNMIANSVVDAQREAILGELQ
jgi:hypothetical protein